MTLRSSLRALICVKWLLLLSFGIYFVRLVVRSFRWDPDCCRSRQLFNFLCFRRFFWVPRYLLRLNRYELPICVFEFWVSLFPFWVLVYFCDWFLIWVWIYFCLLVLIFDSFFFILKHIVFGFDVGDFILKGEELVFFVFEFVELFFEGGDHGFFLEWF